MYLNYKEKSCMEQGFRKLKIEGSNTDVFT